MAMLKTSNLPGVRVTPTVRETVESVLVEGETLGQFIEQAVLEAAHWRRAQTEYVRRGEAAIDRWRQDGGGHTVDQVLDDLQARLASAKKQHAAKRAK